MISMSAQLVADGVGLPLVPMKLVNHPVWPSPVQWMPLKHDDHPMGDVLIDRIGILQEMLRQLAMWCGDDGKAQAYSLHRLGTGWALHRSDRLWLAMGHEEEADAVAGFTFSMRMAAAVVRWLLIPGLNKTVDIICEDCDGGEWESSDGNCPHCRKPPLASRRLTRLEVLVVILTHIGHDHAIRRALGWGVEPGTLATLERLKGRWVFTGPNGEVGQTRWGDALANITDPTEALAAIYAEVCE